MPDAVCLDYLHKPLQLSVVEDLLGSGFLFGQGDALGRVPGDEVFPHRRVHGLVEHPVDPPDGAA